MILVGDLNSDRDNADSADPAAYNAIRSAGFRDAWITIRGKADKGYSCCLKQEDITDPPPAPFDHRIDHIFTKPKIRGSKAVIVGKDPKNRTAGGLWPSTTAAGPPRCFSSSQRQAPVSALAHPW